MPLTDSFPAKIISWLDSIGIQPFPFQEEVWSYMAEGKSGLLNAPTGSGKTYALWLGALARLWPETRTEGKLKGVKILWITPLRSLSKDTHKAMQRSVDELNIGWKVELRTGDTSPAERTRQKKNPPDCLIITPESLHLLLSQKEQALWFSNVSVAIVDEWHDLLGSKRGVQVELALSRIKSILGRRKLITWAISATLPDLDEACHVLLGQTFENDLDSYKIVKANIQKKINIQTLFPSNIERFPWGGRMGLPMLNEILEVIENSKSTLVFTNTRAQTEVWYQNLLLYGNDLAGNIAIHHSSLDLEIRQWVENSLKESKLKVVVCTSSLDLGVDFAPVETIIQIGSPKDVSRILQRAGRSGHGPGRESKVYFVPTHSLELIDASAIQFAVANLLIEDKRLIQKPMDVLVQWLVTLAVGDGLDVDKAFLEVKSTYTYRNLSQDEWDWALFFITKGGQSFSAYDDFTKVQFVDGLYRVSDKRTALRHRLSMGTIVSNVSLKIKYMTGGYLGTVEEYFFSKSKVGDVFWFGGKALEILKLMPSEVLVKKATKGKGSIPSWAGGRMPLSSTFAELIRMKMNQLATGINLDKELLELAPLVEIQKQWSAVPQQSEFLVEYFKSKEGWHLCFYPFDGRYIHEILASLIAFRIAATIPISFSIAMNDYGFELLADQELDVEELLSLNLFSINNLEEDLKQSINEAEMARRRFRDIASIAGMVFHGYPGKQQPARHLQASAQLIYDVLAQYEPDNLLFIQAHNEVLDYTSESSRLVETLQRINNQKLLLKFPPKPTPLAFPILVDRLRAKLTSENLEDQVERLTKQLEDFAIGKKEGSRKMERNKKKEGHE